MARSRASDFEDKQRAILISAAAVLAEQGMDKASMAQIAVRAGVSKALLYHYYPGRAALILAIIRTHLDRLEAAIDAADRPDLAPGARLRVLVGAVLETCRDADDAHKVQVNGTPTLAEAHRAVLAAIERRILRRFSSVLGALHPDLPSGVLTPVTMSLFGMLNWACMWFRDGGALTRAEYADLVTVLVLEGIGGVGKPGAGA